MAAVVGRLLAERLHRLDLGLRRVLVGAIHRRLRREHARQQLFHAARRELRPDAKRSKFWRPRALAKPGADLTKFAQTRYAAAGTHPAPNRPLAARRGPQMRPRQRPQNSSRPRPH